MGSALKVMVYPTPPAHAAPSPGKVSRQVACSTSQTVYVPGRSPENRYVPPGAVVTAPETGPVSWMHQPSRPLHGAKSWYTWPSIDMVPPPAGALPHVPVVVGGGGGGGFVPGSVTGSGHFLMVAPGCSAARMAQWAASWPSPGLSSDPEARDAPFAGLSSPWFWATLATAGVATKARTTTSTRFTVSLLAQ